MKRSMTLIEWLIIIAIFGLIGSMAITGGTRRETIDGHVYILKSHVRNTSMVHDPDCPLCRKESK